MIAALRAEYPGLLVMGCYFHFSQALVRKLQEFHLMPNYEQDVAFQTICRQFGALAFVPLPAIRETFDLLVASIPQRYVDMLAPFVAYFQVIQKYLPFPPKFHAFSPQTLTLA